MMLIFALAFATYAQPDLLVDTEWLAAHLNDPNLRIVDMRTRGYEVGHIPNAVYLANDDIRDRQRAPTFVPATATFEQVMSRLGISNATRVIAYDDRGGIYAARLWWILNLHGHTNVALLNGGWVKWTRESRTTSTERPTVPAATFTARVDPRWVATAQDVVAGIDKAGVKIVDARTQAEIEGRDLRGIRRGGAIPSSIPVYWEDALDPDLKTFKTAEELEKLYASKGITRDDDIITYCQVGMRASHDLFVLRLLGYSKLRNYYGSWEEWGNRDDLPIKR
jgi:thiosulfate/3-mercaptopyruvate sulfurtransferase